jgi:Holliday junction resolvase RusA-like endonuclease
MSGNDSPWPLRITVPGKPVGKERPRLGKGRVYTPAKTRDYEDTVGWAAKAAMGRTPILTGPVGLTIICYFSNKTLGWHVNKPDADNLIKALADGMNGIVYKDDCQVARISFSKIKGLEDKVEIMVRPLREMV